MHLGLRAAACVVLAFTSATAPYQCARKTPTDQKMEDEADEVLYQLAEKFKAAGDQHARVETLKFLRARYPSSRFSVTAKHDLEELGVQAP